jgi:hypothetical protein
MLTTLAVVSCSNVAEQPILDRFFAASRLRDNTALQQFSTVTFEPGSQGIIASFEITAVGPERHDGDLASKEVTISAPVRLPSGQTSQKTLIVTMQRAILKGEKEITGRWIITGIKETQG